MLLKNVIIGTIRGNCLQQESSNTGNSSQTSSTSLGTSVLSSRDGDSGRGWSNLGRAGSRRLWAGGNSGGGDDLGLGAWAVSDGQGGSTGNSVGLTVGNDAGWLWAVGGQSSDNLLDGGLVGDSGDGTVRVSSESSGSQSKWGKSSELHFY